MSVPRKTTYRTTYNAAYSSVPGTLRAQYGENSWFGRLEQRFDEEVNYEELNHLLDSDDENASVISEVKEGDYDLEEMKVLLEFVKTKVESANWTEAQKTKSGRLRPASRYS
jgi:hypothetical protein